MTYTVTFADPDGSGSVSLDVEAEDEAGAMKAFLEQMKTNRMFYTYSGIARQSFDSLSVAQKK